jgi:esterase/lipase
MSSPVGMSSLQDYFEARNYRVVSILLPGHGTKPADLEHVTYEDWLNACRQGIKKLRKTVDHVTVIAFSAGTTVAIHLSLTENSIDRLVLFAPALRLTNPLIPFVPLLYRLGNCSSRINWIISKQEDDYAKYQSLPINAVYQISQLMHLNAQILAHKSLTIPLYIVSTEDDETISHKKALDFFLQQRNSLNRGIIYTTNPSKLRKNSSNSFPLNFRTSAYPEQNILDFSHTALAVAPNHPHYGKQGDYKDFSHYSKKTLLGLKDKPIYYGAASNRNMKKYRLQRLSYNPDFAFLMDDIEKFFSAS